VVDIDRYARRTIEVLLGQALLVRGLPAEQVEVEISCWPFDAVVNASRYRRRRSNFPRVQNPQYLGN